MHIFTYTKVYLHIRLPRTHIVCALWTTTNRTRVETFLSNLNAPNIAIDTLECIPQSLPCYIVSWSCSLHSLHVNQLFIPHFAITQLAQSFSVSLDYHLIFIAMDSSAHSLWGIGNVRSIAAGSRVFTVYDSCRYCKNTPRNYWIQYIVFSSPP